MNGQRDAKEIEGWLTQQIAREIGVDPGRIDARADLSTLGLDSPGAVSVAADLGKHVGMKLSPTLAWDHPTIEALAAHVAALVLAKAEERS